MSRRKYYKKRYSKPKGKSSYKKRNYNKKGNRYNEYTIYGVSSTVFYIIFQLVTYQLGLNNPFYDSNPGLWLILTYFFTELVGVFAYKYAFRLVGEYGIKGTGGIRAAIRSGEHWITRLIIYAFILFATSIILWIAYGISLLF